MRASLYSSVILVLCGYIANGQGLSYFTAGLGIALAVWVMRSAQPGSDNRFLILDPDNLRPEPLKQALVAILDEVRQTQRTIHLRLAPLTPHLRYQPQLQLNHQSEIEIVGCTKKAIIRQPKVWIADHPLPLPLATDRCSLLTFNPTKGDRVRVALNTTHALSKKEWLLLGLILAFTALLGYHGLFSAILAFTLQSALVKSSVNSF
jgi:predicted small integral membrane protein